MLMIIAFLLYFLPSLICHTTLFFLLIDVSMRLRKLRKNMPLFASFANLHSTFHLLIGDVDMLSLFFLSSLRVFSKQACIYLFIH